MSASNVLVPYVQLVQVASRNLAVPNNLPGEGQPTAPYANPRGDLLVVQELPERTELARLGGSVMMRTDAVACVTAIPTTTAAHTLWNGEQPGTGKALVIDRLTWMCTTSAAAASAFSLVAVVNKASTATVPATADTQAQTVYSTGKAYAGKAKTSHTVTVVDDVWFPVGPSSTPSALTGTVGVALDVPINGSIILAPGYVMGVSCVAVNTTAAGKLTFWFHEAFMNVVTS